LNADVAEKLVLYFLPLGWGWLAVGLVVAVLYHVSLWLFDGEFRVRNQVGVDIAFSVLRGLAYVLLWPAIFIFDRTAWHRIRLLVIYLVPEWRAESADVRDALKERDYRQWSYAAFVAGRRAERRRWRELETGEELYRRLREIRDGNPVLERTWMLTGVGSNPGGVQELVRLYPDYHLPDEVENDARREIVLRRPWNCTRCHSRVPVREVKIPGVVFLRVLEPEGMQKVVEGWALQGECTVEYEQCPQCGAEQPVLTEDLARFGHATDVVKAVRLGLNVHLDLP
jgi:hypothetical protein